MRRVISVLLVFIILTNSFLFLISFAENSVMVQTTVSETNALNQFTVDFLFNNVTSLLGFKITLKYDNGVLKPISVTAKGDYSTGNIADTIDVEDDEFNVLWNDIVFHSSSGTAFSVVFERLTNDKTMIYPTYSQDDTFDQNWDDVGLIINNIEVPAATTKITGSFIDLNQSSINSGFFRIKNSANTEIILEDNFSSTFDYIIPKTQKVSLYLKPKNRISLTINNVSAQQSVDLNNLLEKYKSKTLFNYSNWSIGDVTNDDVIDIADIALLLNVAHYGLRNSIYDLNQDEIIDIADISVILSAKNYGMSGKSVDELLTDLGENK